MKRILCCLLAAICLCLPASAGDTPAGYVALTFDDGPSGPITMRLLDGLRERGAHATFFLCGYRMEQYPAPVPRYLAEGHELGVHSTVHANLTKLSPGDLRRDLSDTVRAIETSAGVRPTLLRPPGGAYNEAVLEAAEAKGLSVILWSVDTRDWAARTRCSQPWAAASATGISFSCTTCRTAPSGPPCIWWMICRRRDSDL